MLSFTFGTFKHKLVTMKAEKYFSERFTANFFCFLLGEEGTAVGLCTASGWDGVNFLPGSPYMLLCFVFMPKPVLIRHQGFSCCLRSARAACLSPCPPSDQGGDTTRTVGTSSPIDVPHHHAQQERCRVVFPNWGCTKTGWPSVCLQEVTSDCLCITCATPPLIKLPLSQPMRFFMLLVF